MGDDLRLVVAVAAFERVDRAEALLERGERARVVLDALGQVADLGGDVLELGLEAGEPFRERLEPRVEAGQAARLADRDGRRRRGRRRRRRSSASWTAAAPRAIASPCWAAASRARISSASPGPQPRRRRSRPTSCSSRSTPAGQLARVDRQLGQRRPVRPPALDDVGHRRARRAMPAEGVEQVALPALVEQPLLVVLAVDLDERPDLVGEPRCGRRQVVEPGGRATAGRHLAHGDQRLRQPVEQCLDPRDLRAVADQAGVRARAADEPEGVDQQALAGAGLAGDDVEARLEGQAQPVDEREVARRSARGGGRRSRAVTRAAARPCGGAGPRTAGRPRGSISRIGRSTARDLDDVADLEREVLAAIDRDERLERVDDRAADDLVRADHDRADRRQVGGDRRHDEVAADRVEDRAAGRERVAGRAGRARDRRGRRR